MRILNEGGNIWPECEKGFDPSKVGKPLTATTQKYLDPTGAKVEVVGSCWKPRYDADGNVVPSNDLDAMVDLDILMKHFGTKDSSTTRRALSEFLQNQGLTTKLAGVTVHTKVPMKGKCYQVDIKVVKNAASVADYHRHDIPKGSPYKGVHKQVIMAALASTQNMLWSSDEGLYARDSAGKKAELLATSLDDIAQYLLGKGATAKDLNSAESILAKISDPKRRQEILDIAKSGHSWQELTPTVTEWFRSVLEILK